MTEDDVLAQLGRELPGHGPGVIPTFDGDDQVHTLIRAFEAEINAAGWDGDARLAVVVRQVAGVPGHGRPGLYINEIDVPRDLRDDPLQMLFHVVTLLRGDPDVIAPMFHHATPGFPEGLLLSVETLASPSCDGKHGPDEPHEDGPAVECRVAMYLDTAARRVVLSRDRGAPLGKEPELIDYANPRGRDLPVLVGALPVVSAVMCEAAVLVRGAWPKGVA